MKKILIVIPYFIPAYSYGGPVKVAYDHILGLIGKGYDVTVVTTDALDAKNRNKVKEEVIDGIRIIRFRNLSNYLAKFHNIYMPWGMKKWFKANISDYDIVHIHDILNLPAYWGMKYAYENKVKYFLQPHGILSMIRIESRKGGIKKRILGKMKKFMDSASGFFALTAQEKIEIEYFTDNERVYDLPNGLYLEKFQNLDGIDLHNEYNLEPSTKIITFLGRVQYIKGLDISLEVLAELDKEYKDWVFLVIGPDEGEKENLVKLAKDRGIEDKIIWYGMEKTEKRYSLLKSSDLFLFTSRAEGFPMTILEAMAANIPVLISEGCNLPEVGEYQAGEVVRIDDIGDIVIRLKNILENKEKYILGGDKLLKEKYSLDLIIDKLVGYYYKIN